MSRDHGSVMSQPTASATSLLRRSARRDRPLPLEPLPEEPLPLPPAVRLRGRGVAFELFAFSKKLPTFRHRS